MTACEECWTAAYIAARTGVESQVEAYKRLLQENPDHEPEGAP